MARTSTAYAKVIDDLKVETNARYKKNGSTTYCNLFAQDVASGSSASLPSGTCATMLSSLLNNGFPKWYSVTYTDAQSRANSGN